MRIAILGIGGVGGYFGGRLAAESAHEVAFIARGAHLAAIREHGIEVHSDIGDFVARPALATDQPAEVGAVDVVLVAIKTWQVPETVEAMRPLIGPETVVIPLLNGVEAPAQLADALGAEHVLGGFCRVQSAIDAPGRIRQGGAAAFIVFGEMNGERSPRLERLREVLDVPGITVQISDRIQADMWQKLLFVAALGSVGAVTRMPAGIMRGQPETRAMLEDAMSETLAVARGLGLPMADDAVARGMKQVDDLLPGATASMQRDIMDGRPSELEAQNGAIVRFGEAAGVATPVNRFLYHALLPTERRARGII